MNRLLLNRRRSVSRSQPKMKPAEPKKEEKKMDQSKKQQNSKVGFIKGMFVRDTQTGEKIAVKATPEVLNMLGGSFRVEDSDVEIPENVMEIALNMHK